MRESTSLQLPQYGFVLLLYRNRRGNAMGEAGQIVWQPSKFFGRILCNLRKERLRPNPSAATQCVKKASQSSCVAVGSCAAIRMRPAPCRYAARRRRKKGCNRRVPSSRRSRCGLRCKHAAGMFAYAAASEKHFARSERRRTRQGPRRRAERTPFGGKGVSLFRQPQVAAEPFGRNPIPLCAFLTSYQRSDPPRRPGRGRCSRAR